MAHSIAVSENGNGPQNLEKLFSQIKGMAREARRSLRSRKNRVHVATKAVQSPRFSCDVCGVGYDLSLQKDPGPPAKGRCGDCKNQLVSGFTAFVTKTHHVWAKVGPTCGLKASQVYIVTEAQMEVLKKRFQDQNGKDPLAET